MAHWGIAYGGRAFLQPALARSRQQPRRRPLPRWRFTHIALARERFGRATPVERRLVEALSRRYQKPHAVPPEEFDRWDDDYAAEMRRVYYEFPDDHDMMALLVEALITRTPRRLWDIRTGFRHVIPMCSRPCASIERSIALADAAGQPQHPAIVHLHIHVLEMSNHPEDAVRSADSRDSVSGRRTMNHMPGHIYVLCGDYEKAMLASEKAIAADNSMPIMRVRSISTSRRACHDLHLMIFTCMFLGQYGGALEAANTIRRNLTERNPRHKGPSKARLDHRGLLRDEDARAGAVRAVAGDHR